MADAETPDVLDAYSLLSKPTLELTDAEAALIVEDLRKRRKAYLTSGKPDKPKAAKVATAKASADEKARNTAALLAQIKIPGLGK